MMVAAIFRQRGQRKSSRRTGQVRRLDTMMVTLGGIGHFVLIVACLVAFINQTTDNNKWWKFVAGAALTLAYFAPIVAVARPR
jgi:hypothetical protein